MNLSSRFFVLLMLLVLAITCQWVLSADNPPAETTPFFQHLGIEDGLSSESVTTICQDRLGFMWFGTIDGLNRYDGYSMKLYPWHPGEPDTLSYNMVSCSLVDGTGTLWVGTNFGGLSRYRQKSGTFVRYYSASGPQDTFSPPTILTLYEDRAGTLWIGSERGMDRYDRKTDRMFRYRHDPQDPHSLSHNYVTAITGDSEGNLWIGTRDGLNRMDTATGTFTRFHHGPAQPGGLADNYISSLAFGKKGLLWIGLVRGGVDRWDIKTGRFHHFGPGITLPTTVTALLRDKKGNMWIGSGNNGLFVFDPESGGWSNFRHNPLNPSGISFDAVSSLYEDRTGLVWIGTPGGGVNFVNPNKPRFYRFPDASSHTGVLSSKIVTSFCEDDNGMLWLGTTGGGLNKLDRRSGTVEVFRPKPQNLPLPPCSNIFSLLPGGEGYLWLGTAGDGLIRFHPGTGAVKAYTDETEPGRPGVLARSYITFIIKDRDGFLWLSLQGGRKGLSRFDPKTETFTDYQKDLVNPSGFQTTAVTALFLDSRGTLWIGGVLNGLSRWHRDGNTFSRFHMLEKTTIGPVSYEITSIGEDLSGRLWAGTTGGGGLYCFDPTTERFTASYTTEDGLPGNSIYGILTDGAGYIWLSTNRGISRLNLETRYFKNFDLSAGLQGYSFYQGSYYKSKMGELFFGGRNGFNAIRPEAVKWNVTPPPVAFTYLRHFPLPGKVGRPSYGKVEDISTSERLSFPYSRDTRAFEFAALDYANPSKNRYKYKLEGFQEGWSFLGRKRTVTYNNLPPGTYVLRVAASNNDGVWNENGTSLVLEITPLFWQTWWFRLFCVAVLGLVVYAWHRGRMKHLALRMKTEAEREKLFDKFNLSARERELVALVLTGKSNKEIEDTLFISLKTVQTHVYNIYKKMGIKNRLELINLVQRNSKST